MLEIRNLAKSFGDILPNPGVLMALAAVLAGVAGRTFKIRE